MNKSDFYYAGTAHYNGTTAEFIYNGVNLLAYESHWHRLNDDYISFDMIATQDDKTAIFHPYLYTLTIDGKTLLFGVGEITNSIYGFILPKPSNSLELSGFTVSNRTKLNTYTLNEEKFNESDVPILAKTRFTA